MTWFIECTNCGKVTKPANIVELMEHRDNQGWILCGGCKSRGYIEKKFKLRKGDPQGGTDPMRHLQKAALDGLKLQGLTATCDLLEEIG